MTALSLERIAETTAPAFAPPLRGAVLSLVPSTGPPALLDAPERVAVTALIPRQGALGRIGIAARVAAVHVAMFALWLGASQVRPPEPLPEGIAVGLVVETPAPEAAAAEAPAEPAPEPPPLVAASSEAEPPPAPAEPVLSNAVAAEPTPPEPVAVEPDVPEPVMPEPAVAEPAPPLEPPPVLADAAPAEPAPEPVVVPAPPPPQVLPRPKPAPPARRETSPVALAASGSSTPDAPAEPRGAPAVEQTAMTVPAAPQPLPIVAPRPVSGVASNPKPDYPIEARRRRLEGEVMLRVAVSAAGLPDAVTVLASSGHALLDDAALAAVRRWRFSPATRGGATIAAPVDVPIRFRVED